MANLPETASWDAGVYQLETTDPVLGGPNGKSNLPLKNLANRTAYLKAQVDSLSASKAPLASPALTGAPTAPTAAAGTNTTQIATTEFVKTAIASIISGGIVTSVAGKTGAVTLGVYDISGAAPLASPAFTGTPSAPTQSNTDNSTKLATTAFVKSVVSDINIGVTSVAGKTGAVTLAVGDVSGAAPLASPALTGAPTAPTASAGTSTNQIATTAFVSATFATASATILTNDTPSAQAVGSTAAAGSAVTAARADHCHPMPGEASTSAAGFMSAADKLKLNSVQAGAQANTVASVAGKTGAVTLAVADISGAAPLVSPALTGAPTAPTAAAGTRNTQLATTAFVMGAAAESAPAGMVAHFASSTAPNGWLKANGAAVSRATYAALFSSIGTTFGSGDGATSFNLPDLRGEFIRGWDDSRGIDAGRYFGGLQLDEIKSHTHNISFRSDNTAGTSSIEGNSSLGTLSNTATSATGGTETRPRNVALLACIKY